MKEIPSPARIAFDNIWHVFEVFAFLVIAALAIASITEISSRDSFRSLVQARIDSINSDLVSGYQSEMGGTTNEFDRVELGEEMVLFKVLKSRIESLISVGARGDNQTLTSIRKDAEEFDLEKVLHLYKMRLSDQLGGNEMVGPRNDKDLTSLTPFAMFMFTPQLFVEGLSSDYVLALAIMSCGAIGATVGSIRSKNNATWRSVLFGLTTGFVVFLSIKGGKHFFLLESQGQTLQFNPYSSGFMGLLAGLFTERTFAFLQVAIETVFRKMEKVVAE